ncbi:MAG: ABC transporter substrate-binding protein [Alphaproteobacteria bacterium]
MKTAWNAHCALDRRRFLQATSAMASLAVMPRIIGMSPAAAQEGSTMVIAAPATPQSLDCEFDVSLGTFEAIAAMYDHLLGFEIIADPGVPTARREDISYHPEEPGGVKMVGKLAESWEIDPEGRFARFKLREGVMSNWGNELTAEDVKWTWDRKFGLAALGAFYTKVIGLNRPEDVRVEGKYEVSFNLDEPNPLLLKIQPNLYGGPIYDSVKCKEMATADDPWAKQFIENDSAGFGPYRLEQLTRGQQAVFRARDDYWGGKPAIDTVIFREVPTSAARVQLLQGGAVDIAQYLQPLEIISLQSVPNVAVETVPASFMIWIELNAKMTPFDNVDVRRAMNYAFPRDQIMQSVYQGLASPLNGCMPNIYPGYVELDPYSYDLDKARQLLQAAGVGDGFQTTLSYNAGDPVQEPIAILYQSSLREIGVELQLKKVPAGSFYNAVSQRGEPMIFYVDSPWCPDPGYSMQLYFQSESFVNYSNYVNARVDELLATAASTADETVRLEAMGEAQRIVMDEAPWTFIAYPNYTMARKADLMGWTYYTSNNIRFQDFGRG